MIRKFVWFPVVFGALFIFAASFTPAQARVLHYATPTPPTDTPTNQVLKWWTDEVEKRTNGEITIKVHWLGSLVKYADAARGVSTGIADIAPMSPEYSEARLPLWSLSATTIGSGDPYVATEAWRRVRAGENAEALHQEESRFNLKYIAHYSAGGSPILVSNSRPYLLPEHFKGDKVRLSARWVKAGELGNWPVTPVSLPFTDTYSAMSRGAIDGGLFYMQWMITYQLDEVAKYIVKPGLGQQTAVLMMNRDVWNSLTDGQKAVFSELAPLYMEKMSEANIRHINQVEQDIAARTDEPIEIYELDAEQQAQWKKALQSAQEDVFVDKIAQRDSAAWSIHEHYMKALAEVASEVEQDGYPWQDQ